MEFFLQAEGYGIVVGKDVCRGITGFLDSRPYVSTIFILSDSHTRAHCLPLLLNAVPQLASANVLEVDPGESSKSLQAVAALSSQMLERGADRNSLLICLGGGMIGDLGGFVAGVFLRGIRHVLVPTSLLAMVDASVGGKTAVNLDFMKNAVGLFKRPEAVFADTGFLNSLPVAELRSGLAEIIKHSFLANVPPVEELPAAGDLKSVDWLPYVVSAISYKNEVVSTDFNDLHQRKVLNFGHTIGHALEGYSHEGQSRPLLHGEAVALGMQVELMLSVRRSGLPLNEMKRRIRLLRSHYADLHVPAFDEGFMPYLLADKKNRRQEVLCVLLDAGCNPVIDVPVTLEDIREAMHTMSEAEQVN